ncbi:MAG TPA: FHA domain-containing protein [Ktedonobacteraceae bacterium]|nr:FHA domain-containing protein [Ktedonobacteraceae bacterium]
MQFSQSLNQPALRYQGYYYPLNKPQVIIGSDPNCDIRIENNPRVLPMHAQIISQGGQVFLQYAERGAAIWVNGLPASQQMLQDHDRITLGDQDTRLTLQFNWSAAGADQTITLVKRVQPTTDRHTTQQAPNAGPHASQFAEEFRAPGLAPQPLVRHTSFVPQEHMPLAATSTQQEQLAFPTQEQLYPAAANGSSFAPQRQMQSTATRTAQEQVAFPSQERPYPTATNGSSSATAAQMPPTIASTPSLGTSPQFGTPPQTPQMVTASPVYQPQAPMYAPQSAATNTTRYLCAAGRLDEDFQDYTMRHVIYEGRRALGESYGVDMLAVVSWCKAGLRRIHTRDAILTALLALSILLFAYTIHTLFGGVGGLTTMNNANGSGSASLFFIAPIMNALTFLFLLSIALVLLLTFGLEAWIKRRWPNSHPGILSLVVISWLLFPYGLVLIPLSWLVILIELITRFYGQAINDLRKHTFNPQARPVPLDPALAAKLRTSFTTGQRNVVAYSGYRPFAGAGKYLTGWSFVIDTSKGAPVPLDLSGANARQTPQTFTTSSLYEAIARDARVLGLNDVLEIEGKLYVRGQYLPEHQTLFNAAEQRPVTNVDQKLVDYYKENPTEDIRYYQCMRFNSWRGEIIFTAFLRLVQRGTNLFIEFDYLLLPPLKPDYYWVDEREITPTTGKMWELFSLSFDKPIKILLGAPRRLLRSAVYNARQSKLARVARNNPAFDYGAASSLRYKASDDNYHLFFQKLDKEMYLKTIQKQMLETIYDFLNQHQIDTSDFNRQQQTILNAGTIVSGREVNIGAMSTGNGGQAINNPVPPAPATSTPPQNPQA